MVEKLPEGAHRVPTSSTYRGIYPCLPQGIRPTMHKQSATCMISTWAWEIYKSIYENEGFLEKQCQRYSKRHLFIACWITSFVCPFVSIRCQGRRYMGRLLRQLTSDAGNQLMLGMRPGILVITVHVCDRGINPFRVVFNIFHSRRPTKHQRLWTRLTLLRVDYTHIIVVFPAPALSSLISRSGIGSLEWRAYEFRNTIERNLARR